MPCYGPLTAYYPPDDSPDKRLVFDKRKSATGVAIKIPCGKCIGCKLEHSRQWALRCMHEKKQHSASSFLTLTYNDDNLPPGGTLVKKDLQLFMKRLRKYLGPGVRFFACGEYGEKTSRPHYHVLLLSHDFGDRRPVNGYYGSNKSGDRGFHLYRSAVLSNLWTAGNSVIGDVTFDSCAYVARYCTKKITGPKADDHYRGRKPEFLVMSRRPGIGTNYFNKFRGEMYTHDNVIVNGVPSSLPRFYDNKYASLNDTCEARLAVLKIARRRKIDRTDAGTRRLRTRELVTIAKLSLKGRIL
ncbi:MAG: replication initiator protein [Microvirus sp.]|nr:MAG: replication initiator protein [Microvirus sp.]